MAYLSCVPAWLWVEPGSMKTQLELWEIYLPQQSNTSKTGSKAAQLQEMPHFVQQGAQARQPRWQRQTSCSLDTLSPPAQRDAPGTQSQPVPSSPRVTSAEPLGACTPRHSGSPGMQRGVLRHDSEPSPEHPAPTRTTRCYSGGKDLPRKPKDLQ